MEKIDRKHSEWWGFAKLPSASADIAQHLQEEIDLEVTDGRLNDALVRNVQDSVYKDVLPWQNSCEIVLRKISKFDEHNLIIGSLLTKIKSVKLTDDSVKKMLRVSPECKRFIR